MQNNKLWKCPVCGRKTRDFPAISRKDNKTEICSQCGTQEAVNSLFDFKNQSGSGVNK